jgi:hypothetical protein
MPEFLEMGSQSECGNPRGCIKIVPRPLPFPPRPRRELSKIERVLSPVSPADGALCLGREAWLGGG